MQTITPDKLPAWVEEKRKDAIAAVLFALRASAALCAGKAAVRTGQSKPFPAVDTGRLKSSWRHAPLPDGARLWNDAPYAGSIEFGVRPGRIPLPYRMGGHAGMVGGSANLMPFPSLVRWAERKFYGGRRRGGAVGKAAAAQGAFMMAVAVQRKLHYKGIQGRHILTDRRFTREMRDVVAKEIVRNLRNAGGKAHA